MVMWRVCVSGQQCRSLFFKTEMAASWLRSLCHASVRHPSLRLENLSSYAPERLNLRSVCGYGYYSRKKFPLDQFFPPKSLLLSYWSAEKPSRVFRWKVTGTPIRVVVNFVRFFSFRAIFQLQDQDSRWININSLEILWRWKLSINLGNIRGQPWTRLFSHSYMRRVFCIEEIRNSTISLFICSSYYRYRCAGFFRIWRRFRVCICFLFSKISANFIRNSRRVLFLLVCLHLPKKILYIILSSLAYLHNNL